MSKVERSSFPPQKGPRGISRFPKDTTNAIRELGKIMGASQTDVVYQDAFRTVEWVIYQQGLGRRIAALEPQDVKVLEVNDELSGEREFLVSYIEPGQEERARRYFVLNPTEQREIQ